MKTIILKCDPDQRPRMYSEVEPGKLRVLAVEYGNAYGPNWAEVPTKCCVDDKTTKIGYFNA